MTPVVAIVGRPNVGKSTLFNRIVGHRRAIVDDQPGVTRDLNYAEVEWGDRRLILVDTGGWITEPGAEMETLVVERVRDAVEEADVVLLVTDAKDGPVAMDSEVADLLRRSVKPTIVAVNKVDDPKREDLAFAFYELGLAQVQPVSSLHGHGMGDLLDLVVDRLPPEEEPESTPGETIKVAIIGRPNVGKSTLLNALVGSERSITSPTPGTTRDPVDTLIESDGVPFLLVDTAGIRRRAKIGSRPEYYSVVRAEESLWRSHVGLLLVDATQGPTESDARVFSLVEKTGRGAIVVVSKWDAVEKGKRDTAGFQVRIRDRFRFLKFAPVLFTSALTGKGVDRILPMVRQAHAQWARRIPTPDLNQLISRIVHRKPPPSFKGKQVKVYYAVQVRAMPPTFALFVNHPAGLRESYVRFLSNEFYSAFGFQGTPIRILRREAHKNSRPG